MITEMMQLVKFREMVMKVENCQGSVVLYKVKGGGVHDFSFSEHWGPILKYPLAVGSKMICQGCNKDLWSQRSKYKSYEALRGCHLGARDCLQVWCRVKTVGLQGSAMQCEMVQDKCEMV